MSIPRKLKGGLVAWVSSCFASLGAYIYTLQTWEELETLPLTAGACILVSGGLGSLAVYLRGDPVEEPPVDDVAKMPGEVERVDIDLSPTK